jgi:Homeodomain-like domain
LVTVGVDAVGVERLLRTGGLECPGCAGRLVPWGRGRPRRLRGLATELVMVRPRRGRCGACDRTHVLLPVSGLSRRADTVEVIGAALEAKACGLGHRRIAERLDRPASTVRGWLRRFASRAAVVAGVFTSLVVALADDPDPVLPAPSPSPVADAVAAVIGAAAAVRARFSGPGGGAGVVMVPVWRVACAVSGGLLLAPGWPPGRAAAM